MTTVAPGAAAEINAGRVAPPTESKTTGAPRPSVSSWTRATTSSSVVAMTTSAPASSSCCRFALVRVSATAFAPSRLASWMAARPTLLDAAEITTVSPGCVCAMSTRPPYAVMYCIHAEAACSKESSSGCATTTFAGARTCSPCIGYSSRSKPGTTLTAWPTWNSVTPSPTAATTPPTSKPKPEGRAGATPYCPRRNSESARLSPHARASIRTSPARGVGSGTSSSFNTSGPPSSWKRTVRFTVFLLGNRGGRVSGRA